MLVLITIAFILVSATMLYMQQKKFGKNPKGARLERIKQSPNFKNGKFQNLSFTPDLTEGYSYAGILYQNFIKHNPRKIPIDTIPYVKSDLLNLSADQNVLVWFGHSSYFMQIDGKTILVDPVFSGNASPLPGTAKSFKGSNHYGVSDIPEIDYLFISHDHYDHVDYETILALQPKVKKVICGLGVGAHFEYWGYDTDKIIENDWYQSFELEPKFIVNVEPARHFSGRTFKRNNTLWVSYFLQTPSLRIYIGGDSGYDSHFANIGKKYHPIDLAIIENGQYNDAWKYIHNLPHDFINAAKDLNAKRILPVHSSKFALASHPWDEPLSKVSELNTLHNLPLITPMIGELVDLNNSDQHFTQWWHGLR